jgi:hypothetical protein
MSAYPCGDTATSGRSSPRRLAAKGTTSYVGAGFHDESRLAPLLRAGTAAVEFLTTSGALELEVIRDMADYYYPVAPGAKAEGRYLL